MTVDLTTRLNHFYGGSSVLSLLLGFGSMLQVLRSAGQSPSVWSSLSMMDKADRLTELSFAVIICHAMLWVGLEFLLGKDYSRGPTPKGLHAAVMSMTLTLPLLIVPVLYQRFTGRTILPQNHEHGAILAVAGGVIAYILVFGLHPRAFPGIRHSLLQRYEQKPLTAELLATLGYALILSVLIATPYRLLVFPTSSVASDIVYPAGASLFTSAGIAAYLLFRYPDSLNTPTQFGFLRGVIAGMFTVVSLCTALYV